MWCFYKSVLKSKEAIAEAVLKGILGEEVAAELEKDLLNIAEPVTLKQDRQHIKDNWSRLYE